MGRRKIEIKPIRDDRNRSVTFLKRKGGLFKKAHELSVLCSVDVAVVIFGHNKKLYEYSSSDINEIVGRFQYYGGAHEHKGPQDFADKQGGGDDDEDDEGGAGEDHGERRGTPDHSMLQHAQMGNHPGFQHVRHGTPSGSPPIPNGAMPQFNRGPSPLPPGMSRPSSRNAQNPQQHRRVSSNLAPGGGPQPGYAYSPNPPFFNPQSQAPMARPPPGVPQGPYPPPYPPQNVPHPQMQQAFMRENNRSPMPPGFPAPPPQANMQRNSPPEHLQPPPSQQQQQPGQPSPRLTQQQRPTPSPQPPQNEFASPPIPQPRPLPANAKSHSIFTPIDDSRSLLAQHWGATGNSEMPRHEALIKLEGGGPRSQSIDVAQMHRENQARANGMSSPQLRQSSSRPQSQSPQIPQRSASTSNTPGMGRPQQPEPKRPRLKVQIPSEQSGDEGGESGQLDSTSEPQTSNPGAAQQQGQQPSHGGVHLPPPSPSTNQILSAGAQGPPNPFARPAPPMSTNPHATNRDAASNHIETPISALPSRFMSDNLLPSPSTFYPEWGFGRGDGNMLPSPLNFQTPVASNGSGWREEERKRAAEEEAVGGESKRPKQ
ncbi:SRF-type transcription factor RlmA like protein [Zymoseptoria brevis]|uniref:SRF-type transcription factor RlmA like protein n=1 Tax=Zymoseptoria brevis TaxID=1047168 RepID=A0A0F4G556_9PEZI|nr:SRF-type transcription factor RlmA like protein [Zymoseptoria brevis]